MAELFTPAQPPAQQRNWMPIIVGLIAVLVVIGIIVALTRNHGPTGPQTNPYANTGDQALVGADMKAVFKNTLDQVVQTETLPLHVLVENQMGGYPDLVDLGRSPIGPGQTRTVRVTLEHISADWNRNYPEIQLVDLKLR
jgi:hypothetical protein